MKLQEAPRNLIFRKYIVAEIVKNIFLPKFYHAEICRSTVTARSLVTMEQRIILKVFKSNSFSIEPIHSLGIECQILIIQHAISIMKYKLMNWSL